MSVIIPDVALKRNKTERLPCVFTLDGSSSMRGDAIAQLQEGLKILERSLKDDEDTADGVQVAIIRMGGHDEITEPSGLWMRPN